jgi:hypothetical protein
LPSRVPLSMPNLEWSQLEEVTGVPESVMFIPSQPRLRESAAHVPLE